MQITPKVQTGDIILSTWDRNIVFHFNKIHLQDTSIPMWVVKVKGQTYYINHLDSEVGFSTKETPLSEHTKGSLKFKGTITIYKEENNLIAKII